MRDLLQCLVEGSGGNPHLSGKGVNGLLQTRNNETARKWYALHVMDLSITSPIGNAWEKPRPPVGLFRFSGETLEKGSDVHQGCRSLSSGGLRPSCRIRRAAVMSVVKSPVDTCIVVIYH
jgi:hypothetical protein